ncbi:MAG: DUF5063 domain-containing protein [Bacteroidales bacterium]|nr:DUF5063 domain-containing protein [Bacteroidales bacterium]
MVKNIQELYLAANNFCNFIESSNDKSKDEILNYLEKILALIYIKGTLLPQVEDNEEYPAERYVTESIWEDIFNNLKSKFAEDDIFTLANNETKDLYNQSLAELITDIYQDIKDFVIVINNPLAIAKANAVNDCRYLFESNWGWKTIYALGYIHKLLYKSSSITNED